MSVYYTTATITTTGHELSWASPGWLWLLLILLPLLALRRRAGTVGSVVHPTLRFVEKHLRRPHKLAGRVGPLCSVSAAAALIVTLAGPQWRNEYEEQKVSGIDMMIACDLSGSMGIRDMVFTGYNKQGKRVTQEVDRLRAAKLVINDFISGRPNDRIGLVAFAGKAKLCSPLTLDHDIVRYIIDQFYLPEGDSLTQRGHAGYISVDGTAIGTAIAAAATRLNERVETKSKVIILVTDGVNNRGSLSPIEAAKQAAELGIRIFTIAIGRDERLSRYTADVDTFDEKTLREIAKLTGGRFYRAGSGAQLEKAFDAIDRLEKTDATRRKLISYETLYMYPLALAGLLLLAAVCLNYLRPRPAP